MFIKTSKIMSAFIKTIFFNQKLELQLIRQFSRVQRQIFKPARLIEQEKLEKNCGKINAVNQLQEVLEIKRTTALDLVMEHKKLSNAPKGIFKTNFDICSKYHITLATCLKYPEILIQPDLEYKLNLISAVPYQINECAPLVLLETNKLERYLDAELDNKKLKIRVDLMSVCLLTKPEVIFDAFIKRPFLRNLPLSKFEQTVNLLLDNGIRTEQIIKDWWVLQYSITQIEERFAFAKANNVEAVKTWMVRASESILNKYLQRRNDNKVILGDSTLAEYLATRLECTKEVAHSYIAKLPALQHKNIKKLQEIIDFLYSIGYKPFHICRVPKILLHSVQTTKKRICQLQSEGIVLDSLYILTKSQKQYLGYYEILVKNNKSKIKMHSETY